MGNAAASKTDDAVAVLALPAATITSGGQTLNVAPITLGELAAFSAAARPVFGLLRDIDPEAAETFLFDLLENHTAELAALIAVGARVDAAWLLTRPLDDVATIAEAVLAANRDFFIQRLLPLLAQAIRLGAAPTGATSSSASAAPDSPMPTSSA